MKPWAILSLVLLLIIFVSSIALAAGSYDISWWTVDGGGGTSSGTGYTLNGTLGQLDAGTLSSGGGYTLADGFWHGGVAVLPETMIFLPLLVK
jgi:hypothetical protein